MQQTPNDLKRKTSVPLRCTVTFKGTLDDCHRSGIFYGNPSRVDEAAISLAAKYRVRRDIAQFVSRFHAYIEFDVDFDFSPDGDELDEGDRCRPTN